MLDCPPGGWRRPVGARTGSATGCGALATGAGLLTGAGVGSTALWAAGLEGAGAGSLVPKMLELPPPGGRRTRLVGRVMFMSVLIFVDMALRSASLLEVRRRGAITL